MTTEAAVRLTEENYRSGFLVDDEYLAGVSEDAERRGAFVAYVLCHTTGEYVGFERHGSLKPALERLNAIPRAWSFEGVGDCGGGCADGACGKGACGGGRCRRGSCRRDEILRVD